ncbi:hypothetical protein Bca52824_061947 [Brassica carinata]|uniref:Glucose-methanol-choline oxidoreductase N-terminal domain-containing protein n=1 Tax=Brassica carinata TaxID=52824 RepID=A0A8X7U685_BRACI|nr:hypothetical protein Bca52824_061947 [Brassica carinata]
MNAENREMVGGTRGKKKRGHPLLRWSTKQETFSHGFSQSDLQALSAICEAIMPPVPLLSLDLDMKLKVLRNDALLSFFKSSGSHVRPDEVAEVMATKAMPVTVTVVRIVLRLLTFRLGTLLLCGFVCLDKKNWSLLLLKFSDISLEKREKILQKWNKQWYNPLARIAFMMIKAIFLFYYFTWTNENTENPAWDAIGYKVDIGENEDTEHEQRPLEKGIIETAKEDEATIKQRMINKVVACGSLMTPGLLSSSGLRNPNIGRGLHIHPILMAWGYFPEKNSDFNGAAHEGEIMTSLHYVFEIDSTTPNITLETPALGPGTFAALIPWVSGSDVKVRLAKYARTSHIFVTVRDEGVFLSLFHLIFFFFFFLITQHLRNRLRLPDNVSAENQK